MYIPFNKNTFDDKDIEILLECFKSGNISGGGKYTRKVIDLLIDILGTSQITVLTSCTHALETAMILLDIREGDEVIIPSFTFPSTANAVLLRGAKPIFVDIDPINLNIDITKIEEKISNKTKVIIPVHYAGIPCDMEKLKKLARKYNISVVEDAAQSFGTKYKGKSTATLGDFGCFSFHATKNYIAGEGGALIQNIDNKSIYERTDLIIQKGTNRKKFLEGKVDKYTWVDIGSNYTPSDILMAILYTQLQKFEIIKQQRKKIFDIYYANIKQNYSKIISRISIPEYCDYNYHMFYIILESEKVRNLVMYELQKRNIHAYFHFMPLHSSYMGKKLNANKNDCLVTEKISKTLLRLPIYNTMSKEEALYVVENLNDIIKKV